MRQNRFAVRGWPSTPHHFEKDALDLLEEVADQYDWSKASGSSEIAPSYVERKKHALSRVIAEKPKTKYQIYGQRRKTMRQGRPNTVQMLLEPIMRGRPSGVSIFELATRTRITRDRVRSSLHWMGLTGLVVKVASGMYALVEGSNGLANVSEVPDATADEVVPIEERVSVLQVPAVQDDLVDQGTDPVADEVRAGSGAMAG